MTAINSFDEYSEKASSTAIYPNKGTNPIYPILGLAGEVGELTSKLVDMIPEHKRREIPESVWMALVNISALGQTCEHLKKKIRDSKDLVVPDEPVLWGESCSDSIDKELGDILWYFNALVSECSVSSLSEIAGMNVEKLFSRRDRGVLQGSGDSR